MPMSTKRKAPAKLAAPAVRSSAKKPTRNTVDEAKASISGTDVFASAAQAETIDISSDEPSDDDEDLSDAPEVEAEADAAPARVNGKPAARRVGDADAEASDDGEPTSPSFGELLRENVTIDVPALLAQSSTAAAVVPPPRAVVVPPSHQSLATVLTQALKTDDTDLLESCLHITDLTTIRNTIERIDSSLAGTLLTCLASRLYRRPGRAGSLMTWVQWTLVSHGGALASQPKVVQSLTGLQKVLAERAKGLNSLLALKGKLDLLDGQMDLRRKMQRGSGGLLPRGDGGDGDDVIWVEGEADGDKGLANGTSRPLRRRAMGDDDDDDDDEDEGAPATNGFVGDSDDDDDDDDEDDDDDDESDGDDDGPMDEDEVDHDDVDESMGEDEESDADAAAPPSKVQKVARSPFSKRK